LNYYLGKILLHQIIIVMQANRHDASKQQQYQPRPHDAPQLKSPNSITGNMYANTGLNTRHQVQQNVINISNTIRLPMTSGRLQNQNMTVMGTQQHQSQALHPHQNQTILGIQDPSTGLSHNNLQLHTSVYGTGNSQTNPIVKAQDENTTFQSRPLSLRQPTNPLQHQTTSSGNAQSLTTFSSNINRVPQNTTQGSRVMTSGAGLNSFQPNGITHNMGANNHINSNSLSNSTIQRQPVLQNSTDLNSSIESSNRSQQPQQPSNTNQTAIQQSTGIAEPATIITSMMKQYQSGLFNQRPGDLLESAALLTTTEFLVRSGLTNTLKTMLAECEALAEEKQFPRPISSDEVHMDGDKSVPSSIMEVWMNMNEASSSNNYITPTIKSFIDVLSTFLEWCQKHPLVEIRRSLTEFAFVAFVELWFRLWLANREEASNLLKKGISSCSNDEEFKRPENIWPHHINLINNLNAHVQGTHLTQSTLGRRLLDGHRFHIKMTEITFKLLSLHLLSLKSSLLLDVLSTRANIILLSTESVESSFAHLNGTSDTKSIDDNNLTSINVKPITSMSSTSIPWGLGQESLDASSFVSGVVAPTYPNPPVSGIHDIVEVVDAQIRDRIAPKISGAYRKYGLRPRLDGELTDSSNLLASGKDSSSSNIQGTPQRQLVHPMQLYPSYTSSIRRRLVCRNAAVRHPVDGLTIWPTALTWHIGQCKTNTISDAWKPAKVAWEVYSGNCSMLAVSFDPGCVSGGYPSSVRGESVVRIYDSLSQEILRIQNNLHRYVANSVDKSNLLTDKNGEWSKDNTPLDPDKPSSLRDAITTPLSNAGIPNLSALLTDYDIQKFLVTGRLTASKLNSKGNLEPSNKEEEEKFDKISLRDLMRSGSSEIPKRIRTMLHYSVNGTFSSILGKESDIESYVTEVNTEMNEGIDVSETQRLDSVGITPTSPYEYVMNRDGVIAPPLPWQAELPPKEGIVSSLNWVLGEEDAEVLSNQLLLCTTTCGRATLYRLPSRWDLMAMESIGSLTRNDLKPGAMVNNTGLNNVPYINEGRGVSVLTELDSLGTSTGNRAGAILDSSVAHPFSGFAATAHYDWTLQLWNLSQRSTPVRLYNEHNGAVTSTCFHPNGVLLASGSTDNCIRLWDIRCAKSIATLTGHSRAVKELSYSPSGGLLASSGVGLYHEGSDNSIFIWDMRKTGQCVEEIKPKNYNGKREPLQHAVDDIYGDGVVSGMAWSKGSQVLSIGFSSGIIANIGVGQLHNELPLTTLDTSKELMEDIPRKVRHYTLEPGVMPIGLCYTDANLLQIATCQQVDM